MRDFDGGNDHIHFGTVGTLGSSLGDGVTIAMWVAMHQATQDALCGILNDGNNTGLRVFINTDEDFLQQANETVLWLRDEDNNYLFGAFAHAGLYDGNPHHLVLTLDGPNNALTAYVDRVSQAITYNNQDTPDNFANFAYNFAIGAHYNRAPVASWGEVDICDFQMFTGIATQADVNALMYHAPHVAYGGLTKCWLSAPMRYGEALKDYSGLANAVTNVGSTELVDPSALWWGQRQALYAEYAAAAAATLLMLARANKRGNKDFKRGNKQ